MAKLDIGEKVRTHKRKAERDLRKTLNNDLNKYLGELITNSDDSYKRLEESGILNLEEKKEIRIEILKGKRKHDGNIVVVKDFAEGFTEDRIKEVFLEYGGDNAGGSEFKTRGIFGQGASDVMFSAALEKKSAKIETIKDNIPAKAKFHIDEDTMEKYVDTEQINISNHKLNEIRKTWGIKENGTRVIFGIPDKIDVKNEKKVISELEKFYMFRYLLNQKNREISIRFNKKDRIVLSSEKLQFSEKKILLDNKKFSFEFDDEKVECFLSLYENKQKSECDTQIIIRDQNFVVFDNTMFKYETYPQMKNVSGELIIPKLYDICKKHLNGEEKIAILTDNREGLDSKTLFYKELHNVLSPILQKFIKENTDKTTEKDLSSNKKISDALSKINKVLSEDFNDSIESGINKGKNPPSDGLRFIRPQISVTMNKSYDLKLLINSNLIPSNTPMKLFSEANDFFTYNPQYIEFDENEANEDGLVLKSIVIKGLKVSNDDIVLKCEYQKYAASVLVNVINENIHYPVNGLEFYPNRVSVSPNDIHTAHLFIDTDIISLNSKIKLDEILGEALFYQNSVVLNDNHLINSSIAVIDITYSGTLPEKKYILKAFYKDIEAFLKIECKIKEKDKKGQSGLISGIKIAPDKVYYQSYFDLSSKYIVIMGENEINKTLLGDTSDLSEDKPKFNKEQTKYLCDLISFEVSKIYVNGMIEKGKISIGQEGHEEYLKQMQIKKNEFFKIIYDAMKSESKST